MCAPTRLNRQPWRFVVIRDQALQQQLANMLRVHPYLEMASAVVAVCSVPKLSPTWLMDTSAAIENMLIGATAMGIGTAWVGAPDTVAWDMCEEALHDALEIPLDVRIVALVAVGYPEQEPEPHGRQDRFDAVKVHYGRWGSHGPAEG
jgi:nitroreductase